SIIEASPLDARNLTNKYENETFDRILIDAPGSGLGVIRNKPDIKYNKSLADVEKLQSVQGDILEEAVNLLKKHRELVYSTCTVDKLENYHVIKALLNRHPEYEVACNFMESLPH